MTASRLIALLGLVLGLGLGLGLALVGCKGEETPTSVATSDDGRTILFYRSPMDPSFVSRNPGRDPMGMELVPVREGDPGANLEVIQVGGATLQRMGVRTAPVKRARPIRIVRALGSLQFDETRVTTVNMKFDGWIEKLWVDETGQRVERGAPLFAVYSPELLASQQEYVEILRAAGTGPHASHLVRAARERLLQFDVPKSFVDRLERTLEPHRRVTVHSPGSGYVVHKTAFEGTFVKKGANLFELADLDALWVIADVFELDTPWVEVGQDATVELDYLPGQIQPAKVDYIYPTLDPKTRTLQVRLVLPNPKVALKPGMFATVRIHTTPAGESLMVPAEAVIQSGERAVVFVAEGEGRFSGRDVELGVRGINGYQILSGLAGDETVVTSGQFLLDSESRLQEAMAKMLGSNLPEPAPEAAEAPEHHHGTAMEPHARHAD